MSEYHEVDLDLKDEGAIVDALKDIGFNPIVYESPHSLEGYGSGFGVENNSQKANIIVPKKQFKGLGDLGFEKVGNVYVMRVDETDRSAKKIKEKEFVQHYKKHLILKKAISSNKFKKKSIAHNDGKIFIKLKMK